MPYPVLGKLTQHVRLVTRMAQAARIDLVAAVKAGTLDQDGWADMVQTCRRCGWAGQCRGWLDTHHQIVHAPRTCLNRARFEALRIAAREYQVA